MLLPAEQLGAANGLLSAVDEVSRLVSPLAGAGLFVAFGIRAVVALDAVTVLVSAACLLALRVPEPAPTPAAGHWRQEALRGLQHIRRTVGLRRVVGGTAVMLLFIGWSETAFFALITHGLHRSVSLLGVLSPVQAVGAIVGGLLAGPVLRRFGDGWLCAAGALLGAVGLALLAVPSLPVVLLGLLPTGFGFAWILVAYATSIQRRTAADLQGRVYAAAELLAGTPQTIGIATGAALTAVLDYRLLFAVMALATAMTGGWLLLRTDRRPMAVPAPARGGGLTDVESAGAAAALTATWGP